MTAEMKVMIGRRLGSTKISKIEKKNATVFAGLKMYMLTNITAI